MTFVPYGRQDITDDDVDAVVKVLRSDWLTQGPTVPAFEDAVARYCGADHAVAMNSATSALHVACMALDLGPGDWLWTTPITFVASANCALYCGASVDFVDIDPRTYNMSPSALAEKLEWAEREGRLPKIVVPVHLCGQPCEMAAIRKLADQYGFKLIEDASHAIGAKYRGRPVGNGEYSDITIFSFHPVMIITTAEGGMALTNNDELHRRMARLRSHGITREPDEMTHASDGPWYYQQVELGFNYRLTDIQAALGLSQLDMLDGYIERRHAIAARYDAAFDALPVEVPWRHPDTYSSFHLYVVRVPNRDGGPRHRDVFQSLRDQGVGVNLHYIPVHTQPYYLKLGARTGELKEAERYYAEAISLPMFPTLSDEQFDRVVGAMKRALEIKP